MYAAFQLCYNSHGPQDTPCEDWLNNLCTPPFFFFRASSDSTFEKSRGFLSRKQLPPFQESEMGIHGRNSKLGSLLWGDNWTIEAQESAKKKTMKCTNPECPFSLIEKLDKTAKFCSECGKDLRRSEEASSSQSEKTTPFSKNSTQVASEVEDRHCSALGKSLHIVEEHWLKNDVHWYSRNISSFAFSRMK